MANERSASNKSNPLADRLGILSDLSKLGGRPTDSAHYYDLLLECCEKLFDNELEQTAFEDQLRQIFGVQVSSSMRSLNDWSAYGFAAFVQDVYR